MHRGSPEVEKIFRKNKAGTTLISKYDYLVNAIGQRTNVTTSGTAFPATPSWSWGYDSLGQVISADSSVNTSDRTYQYDAIGNRKQSADSLTLPGSDNYTSNALNQYSSLSLNSQPPTLNQYDFDGNLTSGQVPTGSAGLVCDAENRLIAVNVFGQDTIHYTYDAQSRRISRNVGTETTLYVYDAWNVIAEYSGTSLTKTYLWGTDLSGSLQGAGGVGGLLCESQISNSQISNFYPTYDGNGNVSEYLAADGSTAAHFEYDPFGNTVVNTDTNNLFAYRFSTKPLDQVTGLYYYGYRYYDPVTGRWPSRDPIEESGGINLYGFVGNNGVYAIDVLGLILDWSFDDCSAAIEDEEISFYVMNWADDHSEYDQLNEDGIFEDSLEVVWKGGEFLGEVLDKAFRNFGGILIHGEKSLVIIMHYDCNCSICCDGDDIDDASVREVLDSSRVEHYTGKKHGFDKGFPWNPQTNWLDGMPRPGTPEGDEMFGKAIKEMVSWASSNCAKHCGVK